MPSQSRISPWMDEAPQPRAPLRELIDVDVAVIGAGYAGLSSAIALRAEGCSVAVLEREIAGFGASGRNAGHVTPTIGKDLPSLLTFLGREKTDKLVHLAEESIAYTERMIRDHQIDCSYMATGNVVSAVHMKQRPRIEKAARVAEELGLQVRFLEPNDMRDRGLPRSFVCGYLEQAGGTLHPGKYVQGLRRIAIEAGAQLFERTPVSRIEEGPRVTLHTPEGRVRAAKIIIATNAYTPEMGWLRSVIMPVSVSLFMTEPLTRGHREAVNWDGCEGVYTAHEMLESYRITTDSRIVGGSKTVRYGFGSRILPDEDPPTFAFVESAFRARFPELSTLKVERFWSGPLAFTLDFLPALGCMGRHRNIYYGIGYAGHGVPMATYAGKLLADLIYERGSAASVLIDRFRPPIPPEPFRWLIAQGLIKGLGALDRRVDAAVPRRQSESSTNA